MLLNLIPRVATPQCAHARRSVASAAEPAARSRLQPPRRWPLAGLSSARRCMLHPRCAATRLYSAAADGSGPEHDGAPSPRIERRMDTAYVFTADLLADAYQFIVPCYQRVYEWEEQEVTQLLCDIEANLDTKEPDVNKLEAYNLGMLTLKRCTTTPSDKRHDVVDGQQRLTTLTLILAAVKQRIPVPETKDALDKYLRQTANKMAGTTAGPRIRVWQQAAPAFDAILSADAPIDWRDEASSALLSYGPAHRMKDNLAVINGFFDERDAELVEQNDLQPSDILKAELVAVLPSPEGDAFAHRWQDMELKLGRAELQKFLNKSAKLAARVPLAGASPGNDFSELSVLTEKLKKSEGGLPGFALQYLPAALVAYYQTATCAEQFVSQQPYASQADADVNAALLALNYSGLKQTAGERVGEWVPLAMRMLMLHSTGPAALAKMLKGLDRASAYLSMCVSAKKVREKRYAEALAELEQPGRYAAPLSKLELSAQKVAEMRAVCENEQLYKTKNARTVLLRLDLALRESKGSVRPLLHPATSITIEHVLPQSELREGKQTTIASDWLRDFPDATERGRLTHALGNLVLLSGRRNTSASNMEFKEKLQIYFCNRDKTSSISEFALTQQVHRYKAWTPAVLRERQNELLKVLYGPQGWDLQQ